MTCSVSPIKAELDSEKLRQSFSTARPFPHIVIDDFLDPDVANEVADRFPNPDSERWNHYHHVNENLLATSDPRALGHTVKSVFEELNSERFVAFLTGLTGIPNLKSDHTLEGGGLIYTKRKGYLNIHADFNFHPYKENWLRQVNLLVYLNKGWKDQYGGHLELWDRKMENSVQKIKPVFNRAVLFKTDRLSFHGYPDPLQCPNGIARKSLGIYYYTQASHASEIRATNYRPKPSDSRLKTWSVNCDNQVIRFYDWLKRKFGVRDSLGSSFMKHFPQ